MKISTVTAFPISFPIPQDKIVTLGIGRAIKRDAVLVKVVTTSGLVGWGESHAGRSPGAVASLVNTTLAPLVTGMEASDVVGVWQRIYGMQLASHGMGAACAIAMSGLDMALWDIRGKAVGWPLYKLLGGSAKSIPAYAGGISLGYQSPSTLAEEASAFADRGYRALKLRLGDTWAADTERVQHVRAQLGDDIDILTDANAAYTLDDTRRVMPVLDEARVGWLEEPFPAHDYKSYAHARLHGSTPLAAGENHYTRFEFHRVVEDGVVTIIQPDLSKSGGITEGLRIAALASAWKYSTNPHTSLTGLNVSASIHFLCSIDNPGYFEADLSVHNPFRDDLCSWKALVDPNGKVHPPEGPGLGVDIDEKCLGAFPLIDGPGYV